MKAQVLATLSAPSWPGLLEVPGQAAACCRNAVMTGCQGAPARPGRGEKPLTSLSASGLSERRCQRTRGMA